MPPRSAPLPSTTVFLYEFVTSGGLWKRPDWLPVPESLVREGRAMIAALVEDFAALPDCQVLVLQDPRFGPLPAGDSAAGNRRAGNGRAECLACGVHSAADHDREFERLARESDWTLLVAPEIDDALRQLCVQAEAAGARLLSPDSRMVGLASDKNRTAAHLARAGIPVPWGMVLEDPGAVPEGFPRPAVLKPALGAGSFGIRTLAAGGATGVPDAGAAGPWRLEQFVEGRAASVAVLSGPAGAVILPGAVQRLTSDGSFQYLGGSLPLAPELERRARWLARRVVESLAPSRGYWGLDLVLGDSEDGSRDYVIEVNPRITTSYVGVRRALNTNLAGCMMDLATGREVELPSEVRPVEFEADGRVLIRG